ncbi:MAG: hypothetical protein ACLPSW_01905 [Roseiarcus sp.]
MQSFGAADALAGMLEWSEPVIFDRLYEAYAARVADEALVWTLARRHRRVWRALISGDMGKFAAQRREFVVALERFGLDVDAVADGDARILAELNDIVAARFRRCGRLASGYRLALIELAGRLAPAVRAA